MPFGQEANLDASTLFDAICYLGKGRWQRLQDLLSQHAEAFWFSSRFAKALIDLGHIDVAFDTSGRRPEFWSCSPPALVVTESGSAYLAGFRCRTLIDSIRCALNGVGTLQCIEQENAPPAFVWSRFDVSRAVEPFGQISDPHGRSVSVVPNPAMQIAVHAPRISTVADALPVIHMERVHDLERFDPKTAAWQRVESLELPGAYRTSFAGWRHIYKSPSGSFREGRYELVKLLAARDVGRRLHGYDASTQSFQCVLGCEPPGLFRRALVACSGTLPRRLNGSLSYPKVNRELAGLILGKLYN
jgi:hypothetical protein